MAIFIGSGLPDGIFIGQFVYSPGGSGGPHSFIRGIGWIGWAR